MGFFKSLVDKMKDTKDELGKKAAKKAAEVALGQSVKATKSALDSAGKAIERAIFGDGEEEAAKKAARDEQEKPDPFAKLKAAEAAKKEREREESRGSKARAATGAKLEADVDAELAAMKKRLKK